MDDLLSIGDFSRRCGLTPNRLRSYAELGILPAAAVDADSGYRFYSPAQVDRAKAIDLLRTAGVSISEIRAFLREPTSDALDRWRRAIDQEADERRSALLDVPLHLALDGAQPAGVIAPNHFSGGTVSITMTAAARSERGRSRKVNQDALVIEETFAAVADGMGGGPLGERASSLALRELRRVLLEGGGLEAGARQANRRIWRQAQEDDRLSGMGTTVVAAALHDGALSIMNVGDSRSYLLRDGSLRQLTSDHTVVADLVATGDVDPADAPDHPHRHVLTRVLGIAPEVEPATSTLDPIVGDRLVLVTDGITNECSDAELQRLLHASPTPAHAVDALFSAVERAGHPDDATAIVIDLSHAVA